MYDPETNQLIKRPTDDFTQQPTDNHLGKGDPRLETPPDTPFSSLTHFTHTPSTLSLLSLGALSFEGIQLSSASLASNLPASYTKANLSERSSVGSIESVFSSSLSISSASSIEALYGSVQRLSEFLSTQTCLQNLSKEAFEKVSPEEFEENLRRSLVQFSSHMKAEATSPMMLKAASAVRRLARNSANLLRQSLERQAPLASEKRKQ